MYYTLCLAIVRNDHLKYLCFHSELINNLNLYELIIGLSEILLLTLPTSYWWIFNKHVKFEEHYQVELVVIH